MDQWDEPEFYGVDRSSVVETHVRGGGTGAGKALAALVVVLGFGILLARLGAGNPDSTPDGQEVTGELDDPEATTTTTTRRRSTTTTSEPAVQVDEPLFSHETGWRIFLGSDGPLTLLDLDTGNYEQFQGGNFPLDVVAGKLLMANYNSQSIRYVPVASPGDKQQTLVGTMTPNNPNGGVIRGPTEDTAWLPGGDYDHMTWQLWNLAGEPEMISEVASPRPGFGPAPIHPHILGASSGGVFVRNGDETDRVSDGLLVAVTPTHAVVELCETPFECAPIWLDRETWQVDPDIRPPPISNTYYYFAMVVSPDGKRALVPDFEAGDGFLWNLETGEKEVGGIGARTRFSEGGAFSPDGRYAAATANNGRLTIVDTETGELVEWDRARNSYFSRVVFIPVEEG